MFGGTSEVLQTQTGTFVTYAPEMAKAPWYHTVEGLTAVAIAVFAAVQVGVMWWQHQAAHRARLQEAFGALRVDYWAMWSTYDRWKDSHLETLVGADLFDPEEIVPDRAAILPYAGVLGQYPAQILGSVCALAAHAAHASRIYMRLVRSRNTLIEPLEPYFEDGRALAEAQHITDRFAPKIDQARNAMLLAAHEATDLYESLFAHTPAFVRILKVSGEHHYGDLGGKIGAELTRRVAQDRWLTRKVKQFVAPAAFRVAEWAGVKPDAKLSASLLNSDEARSAQHWQPPDLSSPPPPEAPPAPQHNL